MKIPSIKFFFLMCATVCVVVLSYALYLQHFKDLSPCPLCVLQRYAFLAVALGCIVAAFKPHRLTRLIAGVYSVLAALVGAGIAGYHLWIKAHPTTSCGIDPLETSLNKIWTAEWLPSMFYADGLCSAEHLPIFGLSIPQWSLFWFIVMMFILIYAVIQTFKQQHADYIRMFKNL